LIPAVSLERESDGCETDEQVEDGEQLVDDDRCSEARAATFRSNVRDPTDSNTVDNDGHREGFSTSADDFL
jgi:hypothetical protein